MIGGTLVELEDRRMRQAGVAREGRFHAPARDGETKASSPIDMLMSEHDGDREIDGDVLRSPPGAELVPQRSPMPCLEEGEL